MTAFSRRRAASLLSLVALALASPAFAQGKTPESMISHRAVYDLVLGAADGPKAPASARGLIAFDFTGSDCEGWSMSFRQVTELQPNEGETRRSEMSSNTFEEGDGSEYRFRVETRVEGAAPDIVDGNALRSGDGALSLDLRRPVRRKLDLDAQVVFPTDHLRQIVAAAREGRNTLAAKVFDGTDTGEKVYDTLAVIGKAKTDGAEESAAQHEALRGKPRWPVKISYFDEGKIDAEPNYILAFDLYENGVSRALRLDYGDFVLNGAMTKFETLPTKACK